LSLEKLAHLSGVTPASVYLSSATEFLVDVLSLKGLLIISVDNEHDEFTEGALSTFFSYKGTPTSIVFEEEAFSKDLIINQKAIKLDHNYIDDIDEGTMSEKYDFYACPFGKLEESRLIAIAYSDINLLSKEQVEFYEFNCKILGNIFQLRSDYEFERSKLIDQSKKDALTGLFNLESFAGELKKSMQNTRSQKAMIACMVVTLDDFTSINTKYGFDLGNDVLFEIGNKLQNFVTPRDFVGRIGGDRFGIVLRNIGSDFDTKSVATRVANIFRKGLLPVGKELTASIGITVFPDDSLNSDDLIARAEIAAKIAKRTPGTHTAFYKELESNY